METALANDLECVVVSRTRHESNEAILDSFESKGAEIQFTASEDVLRMTEVLTGADAVICTMGEAGIYGGVEYQILDAALRAGVKRFIPNEFGLDTLRLPYGTGSLFDEKKKFQAELKSRPIDFTIIFIGGIFDYFLPNLREYEGITTFGDDLDVPYYTHSREDLSEITLRAAFNSNGKNQYIHLKYNLVTQNQVLERLAAYFPDTEFPRAFVPREEILDGTHEVKAAIWINGHCGKTDPRSMDAAELYPDYKFTTVAKALSDPEFVFGNQ